MTMTAQLKPNQQEVIDALKQDLGSTYYQKYGVTERDVTDFLAGFNLNTLKGLAKAGVIELIKEERRYIPRSYHADNGCYQTRRYYRLTHAGSALTGIYVK